MNVGLWAIVAITGFLALSLAAGLALAAILGRMGDEVSQLFDESQAWTSAPLKPAVVAHGLPAERSSTRTVLVA